MKSHHYFCLKILDVNCLPLSRFTFFGLPLITIHSSNTSKTSIVLFLSDHFLLLFLNYNLNSLCILHSKQELRPSDFCVRCFLLIIHNLHKSKIVVVTGTPIITRPCISLVFSIVRTDGTFLLRPLFKSLWKPHRQDQNPIPKLCVHYSFLR